MQVDVLFNGPEYDPERDNPRLITQLDRIRDLMMDGAWRTLAEIERLTGDPAASVSAQLRHLRKERFGSYVIERQSRGREEAGLFEYRLLPPNGEPVVMKARRNRAHDRILELLMEIDVLKARNAALEALLKLPPGAQLGLF